MSSEVSQLCLEALSPLAEQCAKNQDKESPLFVATRHFLKVRRTQTAHRLTGPSHIDLTPVLTF